MFNNKYSHESDKDWGGSAEILPSFRSFASPRRSWKFLGPGLGIEYRIGISRYIPGALIKPAENADEIRSGTRFEEDTSYGILKQYKLRKLSRKFLLPLPNCEIPKDNFPRTRRSNRRGIPTGCIKIRKEVLVSIYRERKGGRERKNTMLEVLLSIIRKVAAIREPRETPPALLLFSISPFLGRGLSLGFARTSVSGCSK